jgi:hypothetical protein
MRKIHLITGLLVVAATALPAQVVGVRLQKVLGISAENGMVATDRNTLSVFANGNLRVLDGATGRWTFRWDTETLTVKVDGPRWQELPSPLPIGSATGFGLCDPLNQIDQGSGYPRLRSALRPSAKIKSVLLFDPQLTAVVYTTPGDEVPFVIRIALVRGEPKTGYSVVDDDLATEFGTYCGARLGGPGVLYVFADEPAGSSDSSAVYVYALAARK